MSAPIPEGNGTQIDRTRSDGFIPDILRYRDVRGTKCPRVPSGCYTPDYRMLEGPRLDYYLWWREMIRDGKVDLRDDGYAWLHMQELANAGGDPRDVLASMVAFLAMRPFDFQRHGYFVCMSYAVANRIRPDGIPRGDALMDGILRTYDLTSYPIRPRAGGHCRNLDVFAPDCSMGWKGSEEAFDRAVIGIDELVRSTRGMSLARFLGAEAVPFFIDIGKHLETDLEQPCSVASCLIVNGPIDWFAEDLVKAMEALDPGRSRRGKVPAGFPAEFAAVARAAMESVAAGEPWDPARFRDPGSDGFWGCCDLPIYAHETYVPPYDRPSVGHIRDGARDPPDIDPEQIAAHSGETVEGDVPYVPSGSSHPTYGTMGADQTRYYISWRTRMRNGEFARIDSGYLWLYRCECVASDRDPAEVLAEMESVRGGYCASGLDRTMFDYTLDHGLPIPDVSLDYDQTRLVIDRTLRATPMHPMPDGVAFEISQWHLRHYKDLCYREEWFEGAIDAGIRAVDERLRARGYRLADMLVPRKPKTVKLYADLAPCLRKKIEIGYSSVPKEMARKFEGIVKASIACYCRRYRREAPRVQMIDAEDRAFVEAAVNGYLDRMEAERAEARGNAVPLPNPWGEGA